MCLALCLDLNLEFHFIRVCLLHVLNQHFEGPASLPCSRSPQSRARGSLFVESDKFACLCLDLNPLAPTGFSGKGRKREQQKGKRQQERAVVMPHRASWDEAWKRYAARVFHNWSKEARGSVLPRFVHQLGCPKFLRQ